jgi:DNA polymerase-1
MRNILLVDGNNLIHRAYHGIQGLHTSSGHPTNATYGIVNTILNWCDNLSPSHVVVAFDTKGGNFRKDKFDYYKATRNPSPEDLIVQFPDAKKLLKALGFFVVECPGFEGDDIIGTFSKLFSSLDDSHTYILSGDKDLLQLIDERTSVLQIKGKETLTVTNESFTEHFGFSPKEYVDAKAIMGDSSDNIPGVYGIGEKGAYKLISTYHSLDAVYEDIENIKGKTKEKLLLDKDKAYDSKWLATIKTDIEFNYDISMSEYIGYNEDVFAILKEFELFSILERIQ